MPQDPYIREKASDNPSPSRCRREFTRQRITAKVAAEYFERFPKERYQTEVESWRHLQSDNIEFTIEAVARAG